MGAALPVVDLGPGLRATAVAAGLFHSCAVLQPGGIVKCWGGNNAGQLGLGDTNARGDEPGEMGAALPPVDLGPGLIATAIAVGTDHTCAILQPGGVVKCWGYNGSGQLGQGDRESRGGEPNQMGAALRPIDLGTGLRATAITAGSDFTCAVLQPGGIVKCWGYNGQGRLGLGLGPIEPNGEDFDSIGDEPGEMGDALPAVKLGTEHTNVTAISSSWAHTCALLQPCGLIKCWGSNVYGALGYGDTNPRGTQPKQMGNNLPAVDLGPSVRVTAVSAGAEHSCAVLQPGGRVKCWGDGADGRLGLGDQRTRGDEPGEMGAALPAVDLGPGLTAVDVAAAQAHTCALLQPGSLVKCWGRNSGFNSGFGGGELGLGDTIDRGVSPDQMGANLPPVSLT
ncbi:RCC1 domain-containing protein 1 [Pleodorina starrii]|nr:RCC1 domain-containing protein 1 [Pleodorina starrii]